MRIFCSKCGNEIFQFEDSITVNGENICLDCHLKGKEKCSQDLISESSGEFLQSQSEKSSSRSATQSLAD